MAALGVLRAWAGVGRRPPRTLALVDWADEEGARFGRSLFGSSAAAGTFDPAELADARDADGLRAPGVLAENGVDLERVLECRSRLERIGACLELHIEQGPVLEAEGIRAAAVSGCAGVERRPLRDPGSRRPRRHDPDGRPSRPGPGRGGVGPARRGDRARRGGRRHGRRHRASSPGSRPPFPASPRCSSTCAIPRRRRARPDARCGPRGGRGPAPRERGCEAAEEPIWRIEPIAFDPELVALAREACERVTGDRVRALERGPPRRGLDGAARADARCSSPPRSAGSATPAEEDTARAGPAGGDRGVRRPGQPPDHNCKLTRVLRGVRR